MTDSVRRLFLNAKDDVASESLVLPDGSLWSHAATLGDYVYGDQPFTIDQPTVESWVRNFQSGYPKKVPVDYQHGSTTDDPEIRKLRVQGKVPMAGQAVEFRGVFSAADFGADGTLRSSVEKLAAKEGRALDDPRNFGLWMRWQPTEDALAAIKARHLTQLSIAFTSDTTDNRTGESLGPALLAVGLLARPFLDEMISVAASAIDGGTGGRTAHSGEPSMTTKITLLAALGAVLAKPVATEEDAVTELTAFQPEITRLRAFQNEVGLELGEIDTPKAVTRLKALKAENAEFSAEATRQKRERIDSQIKSVLKDHEAVLLPAQHPFWTKQLRTELEAGVALEKTETLAAIKSLNAHGVTKQASGGDQGASVTEEVAFRAKVAELKTSDPEIKALAATNPNAAQLLATKRATEQLAKK